MDKKRTTIIVIISLVLIAFILGTLIVSLINNKTFFKTTYISREGNKEIFIPKYSYFKEECCMTAATFYSLKSKKQLDKEILNYMKDFEYFDNDETYGYQKKDLFIQRYEVIEKGLYRKIIIVY